VKMRLPKNGESGAALIMTLILLALGALLMVPTLNLTSTSLEYHQVVEKNTLETYAADSGVQYALCRLANNPEEFGPEPLSSEVNDRTVIVAVEYYVNNVYKITSTAMTDSASSTTIQSYVSITAGLFDYGMAATDGNISISGNAEVISSPDLFEGDIYANGDINLSGNAEVCGDATATGQIDLSSNASVTGEPEEQLDPPLVFAEMDTSIYLDEANQGTLIEGDLNIGGDDYYDLGPAHITGNLAISDNAIVRLTGTVWIDGTITMSGNSRIEGAETIVAGGDIQVTGNTKLDADNIPLIISTDGNITVTGSGWVSAILYAPNGDITLSGNSMVSGAVVGQNIYAEGNNTLEYLVELKSRSDLPGAGGMNILSYTIQG